jgi:hypothetical protein
VCPVCEQDNKNGSCCLASIRASEHASQVFGGGGRDCPEFLRDLASSAQVRAARGRPTAAFAARLLPGSINTTTFHPCRGHLTNSNVDQSIRRAYAAANAVLSLDVAEDAGVARIRQLSASQTLWLRLPTFLCTCSHSRKHDVRHLDSDRGARARARLEFPSADECHSDVGLNAFRSLSGGTPV